MALISSNEVIIFIVHERRKSHLTKNILLARLNEVQRAVVGISVLRVSDSHQVDIAGWIDADGPLSILPLLNEDSDLEDEVEQYDDDDSDDENIHQSGTRKKTKVSNNLL